MPSGQAFLSGRSAVHDQNSMLRGAKIVVLTKKTLSFYNGPWNVNMTKGSSVFHGNVRSVGIGSPDSFFLKKVTAGLPRHAGHDGWDSGRTGS